MKIRAYPAALPEAERTPDKLVYGWHVESEGLHYLFIQGSRITWWEDHYEIDDGLIEIDVSSAAVKTGRKAKNAEGELVDIYGSMGKMQGGDRVRRTIPSEYDPEGDIPERSFETKCEWWDEDLTWILRRHNTSWYDLAEIDKSQLEIVKAADPQDA